MLCRGSSLYSKLRVSLTTIASSLGVTLFFFFAVSTVIWFRANHGRFKPKGFKIRETPKI